MKAGRMRDRIELMKPVASVNQYGESVTTYEKTVSAHAERVSHRGARSDEVGEHFPDHALTFNIRDGHEVGENWRIKHVGGFVYDVTNIEPNLKRGYLTLTCVRINE